METKQHNQKFWYRENIVLRIINPVCFLIDISSNLIIELNETALEMYSSLGNYNTINEVATVLISKFEDTSIDSLLVDITEFYTNLANLGFINSENNFSNNINNILFTTLHKKVYEYHKTYWYPNRQPYKAKFELSAKCNFHCLHCYQGGNRLDKYELNTKEVKEIFDQLHTYGILYLNLTGGEPLLRSDFKELYTYAKNKGFLIRIFTNGSYLNEDILELLKMLPPDKIIVSIYGASDDSYEINTKVKGVFSKVIENIKILVDSGLNVSLKTILSRNIFKDFPKICRIAEEFNVDLRYAYYIYPSIDKNIEICNDMINVFQMLQIDISNPIDSNFGFSLSDKHNIWKEKYCSGGFVPLYRCTIGCNELSIDYKGNMNACTSYTEYGGNLLKEDLLSIWRRFINIKNESISINNKCVKCDSIYYCNNCPADQKAYYGDAEKVNEILCLFAKAKKMYYKDKMELNKIAEQLKLNTTK